MRRVIVSLVLAVLIFATASVSWGATPDATWEGATWEGLGDGGIW